MEPVEDQENGLLVYLFANTGGQKLAVWLKVPEGYVAGDPINMLLAAYSPASSGNFKLKTTSTLIRKNLDAVTSTTNQRASTTGEFTNTVVNQYREADMDITSPIGQINSVAVSPGDLIKVELERDFAGETSSDSEDTRFIPSATEVSFS